MQPSVESRGMVCSVFHSPMILELHVFASRGPLGWLQVSISQINLTIDVVLGSSLHLVRSQYTHDDIHNQLLLFRSKSVLHILHNRL